MEDSIKQKIVNQIIALLSMTQDDTGSIILVKKPTLISILDSFPVDLLSELSRRIPEYPPPLDSPEWVTWFKNICIKFEIPREKFLEADVDRGDLSKFEANKKEFSPKKRKKLLTVISGATGIQF